MILRAVYILCDVIGYLTHPHYLIPDLKEALRHGR